PLFSRVQSRGHGCARGIVSAILRRDLFWRNAARSGLELGADAATGAYGFNPLQLGPAATALQNRRLDFTRAIEHFERRYLHPRRQRSARCLSRERSPWARGHE